MVIVHSCNVLQKSNKPDLCHTGSESIGCWPPPLPTGLTNSLLWTPPSANTMPYSSCLQVNGTSYLLYVLVIFDPYSLYRISEPDFLAEFWIRIHWIRNQIRIQLFKWIQGLMTKSWKKIQLEFFCFTFFYGSRDPIESGSGSTTLLFDESGSEVLDDQKLNNWKYF